MSGNGVPQNYVEAHTWFNLAASSSEDSIVRTSSRSRRDEAEKKMTAAQIAQAQHQALQWKPKPHSWLEVIGLFPGLAFDTCGLTSERGRLLRDCFCDAPVTHP